MDIDPHDGLCRAAGLTERFRISVDFVLREFCNNQDVQEYIFSPDLTGDQRKYIHEKCRDMRLTSKSQGKEPNRKLHIRKSNKVYSKIFHLQHDHIMSFDIDHTLTKYNECLSKNGQNKQRKVVNSPQNDQVFNRLSSGIAVIVDKPKPNKLMEFRKQLPVWSKKSEVLQMLSLNQVVIITSETGSGKTTQIPQFILENASALGDPCKIICTQPRRISTVSVAERVAAERGERLGDTVGYQIKLKYACSPKSALIYCTNGVLLRTLMNFNEDYLKNVTHIIVDEIHERDKYTDFLLICLKQCLYYYHNLRVILMSATADVELFMSYFHSPVVLDIPGRLFSVREYFLDEILSELDYGNGSSNQMLESDMTVFRSPDVKCDVTSGGEAINDDSEAEMMNSIIRECMSYGEEDCFEQLLHLILSENGNVNHQTPTEGYTPLMVAAAHGNVHVVEQLLHLGANTSLVSYSEPPFTAATWAQYYGKNEARALIELYDSINEDTNNKVQFEDDAQLLLDNYNRTVSDEAIDFDLIINIIKHIHEYDKHGTILVFLPGYEDIISCQDSITSKLINKQEFEILMLHGSMNITAQHCVFDVFPDKQKIVLSTNIAETSITIPDIVYVIDTGRAKEKSYDSISGTCALQKIWISKASVKQRAGRAGRTQPGMCFHIFSKQRYNAMSKNHIPEILRVPLHELCLQTKLLAPKHLNIADYLKLALEPPPTLSVETSIQSLKTLGALNENEELTYLGHHLVQLSVEPRLGKMLIYAIIFKCLDPILTIVACLAYKEPFVLPQQTKFKQIALQKQKQLAGDSLSDHLTLLRAFQIWQEVKVSRQGNDLLQSHFISWTAMETIHATRGQLLSQLRGAGFVGLQKSCTVHELNTNSDNWAIVKAALAAGCYPNIAFTQNRHFATKMEKKVVFNKSSVLHNFVCDKKGLTGNDYCVIYEELSKLGKHCSIRCGTVVTPLTIALVCGDQSEELNNNLIIDDWLDFQHNYSNLGVFRETIKAIINNKIINPHYVMSVAEEDVLNVVLKVLCAEEYRYELQQPAGVGLIPKLFLNVKCRNGDKQVCALNGQIRQRESRRAYQNRFNNRQNNTVNSLSNKFSNGLNINNVSHSPRDTRHNRHINTVRNSSSYPVNRDQSHSSRNSVENGVYTNSYSERSAVQNHHTYGLENGVYFNGYSENSPIQNNPALLKFNGNASYSQNGEIGQVSSQCVTEFRNVGGVSSRDKLLQAIDSTRLEPVNQLQNKDILPLEHLDLPEKTAFFVIKPPDYNCLQMGISQSSWIFSPHSEKKIFKFLTQGFFVILFFSISKTQEFQGFARLLGTNSGDVNVSCPIQWLSTSIIPFRRIRAKNIINSYNGCMLVFQCNDGQEVEFNAGRQLCDMFFEQIPANERTTSRPILGGSRNN